MAKPKLKNQKSSPATKPKGPRGAKSGGGKREREALRGIVIGAVIIAALAGFVMVPIAGKTTFSHLIHALGLQGGDDPKLKPKGKDPEVKSESRPQGVRPDRASAASGAPRGTPAIRSQVAVARPAGKAPLGRPTRPIGVKFADNAGRGAPLERATAADDAALDRLVRRHLLD